MHDMLSLYVIDFARKSHIRRKSGEEEIRNELEVHLLHGLGHGHPLHQQSVHQRFADG